MISNLSLIIHKDKKFLINVEYAKVRRFGQLSIMFDQQNNDFKFNADACKVFSFKQITKPNKNRYLIMSWLPKTSTAQYEGVN